MIWTLTLLGAIVVGVVAAGMVATVFGSKTLGALIGTGTAVIVVATAVVLATSATGKPVMGFSHDQLEADRVMTQQMAVAVGPGMQAQMSQEDMLLRSADSTYVKALEDHVYRVERMLGRVP